MKNTTASLRIARPKSGDFSNFSAARTVARDRNERNGRGHRAIKAQDGSFAVVFRPAVAANRQRRVRTVPVV